MAAFLLVHGAWHGAWCWSKLIPPLTRLGHRAIAFDLPGHGEDGTPLKDVTLDAYARKTAAMLDDLSEPAILVGHSMGGMVISAAAELRPERAKRLAYLCAGLLKNGETMLGAIDGDAGSRVVEVDRSHSPFFSAPDELAGVLASLAN